MPPRDTDRLRGEIEVLFADLWQVPRYGAGRTGFRPPVDCFRTEEPPELTVVVELAGVDPASVELELGDGELSISGERTRPPGPARVYQQMEIEYGRFERHVALGEGVDAEAATATYERGLLRIVLPLAPPPRHSERRVVIAVRRGT